MKISIAKLTKPEVVNVYTKTAPIYDIWGSLTETRARERAVALAAINNGEKVLEVAVGTGLTFFEILKANPDGENAGIDLTQAMLNKALLKASTAKTGNYKLSIGDAYHLQFPDGYFDLLMNNYMFDLLPETDFTLVLAEFKRVLKPGGRIVMVNMTRSNHFYHQFWEGVYRINPGLLGGCRGVLLEGYLQAAGFKDIHREMLAQFGFPSEILAAKI